MVIDGYYYGFSLLAAAVLLAWLAPLAWAIPAVLLAAFLLCFFREPERTISSEAGAVVSPADCKVTQFTPLTNDAVEQTRISIFPQMFSTFM